MRTNHVTTSGNNIQDRRGRRSRRIAAVAAALIVLAAACGDDGAGGSGSATTVAITAPTSGARVGRTFDVHMDLSFPIGEPDTGRQHIHLHYDGSSDYDIVYDEMHEVTGLDPGTHQLVAVVANADHSETDSRSSAVTVEVTDDAGDTGGADAPSTNGGDLGY